MPQRARDDAKRPMWLDPAIQKHPSRLVFSTGWLATFALMAMTAIVIATHDPEIAIEVLKRPF